MLEAKRARVANNDEAAYFDALRALRPLRVLMRAHWERAREVARLSGGHAVLGQLLHPAAALGAGRTACATSGSAKTPCRTATSTPPRPADRRGVAVTTLPGWTVQEVALDDVVMNARIVPAPEAKEEVADPAAGPPPPYSPTSHVQADRGAGCRRSRSSGRACCGCGRRRSRWSLKKGEKAPPEPQALERVFLAVNSPPVRFPPGSWVRISGWMKVPARDSGVGRRGDVLRHDGRRGVRGAADGDRPEWKQFHMYRKVPASGEVRVRMALTGFGTAYFDDIRDRAVHRQRAKVPGRDDAGDGGRRA